MVQADTTDRATLLGVVDAYFDALGARDPSRLNLAPTVRFTENCQVLDVGQALWATATAPGNYHLRFADSGGRDAGAYAVVEEMGVPVIMALRLKVEGDQITEIEHHVARDNGMPPERTLFDPGALTAVESLFEEIVPLEQRSSREVLLKAADSYYDAIEQGIGSIVPVIDDCVRRENGVYTAHNPARPGPMTMSVFEGIDIGSYVGVNVRSRRFPVVDEERCLSWCINFFESAGNLVSRDIKGQGPTPIPQLRQQPSALPVLELFKVIDGKIHRIETVLGPRLPFGVQWNWD